MSRRITIFIILICSIGISQKIEIKGSIKTKISALNHDTRNFVVLPLLSIEQGNILNQIIKDKLIAQNHSIIELLNGDSLYNEDSVFCNTLECFDRIALDTISAYAIVWTISYGEKDRVSFTLYEMQTAKIVKQIKRVFPNDISDFDIFVENILNDLLVSPANINEWFTLRNTGFFVGGITAIIVGYQILSDDSNPSKRGIGIPPEWPHN